MNVFDTQIDPLTGVRRSMGVADGKFFIHTDENVQAHIDHSTHLRNSTEYSQNGIKNDFWHCVHIPETALAKMLVEDGFDGYKASAAELRTFLRRNKAKYGYLFTTDKQF